MSRRATVERLRAEVLDRAVLHLQFLLTVTALSMLGGIQRVAGDPIAVDVLSGDPGEQAEARELPAAGGCQIRRLRQAALDADHPCCRGMMGKGSTPSARSFCSSA